MFVALGLLLQQITLPRKDCHGLASERQPSDVLHTVSRPPQPPVGRHNDRRQAIQVHRRSDGEGDERLRSEYIDPSGYRGRRF